MIENRYKNKIITSFNAAKIKAIVPSIVENSEFFFRIPLDINRNSISSPDEKIKIQIICQDKNTFAKSFSNKFYSDTSNYKTYNKKEENSLLKKFLHKNIFLEYNEKSSNTDDLVFSLDLNLNNDLGSENEENNLISNTRFVNLTANFSKKLFNKDVRNIRIFMLDDKNNILDETDILKCDFRFIKETQKLVDDKLFYQNYFLNSFSDNLKISANKECNTISIKSSSIIDTEMFESFNVSLTYSGGNKNITCHDTDLDFSNGKFVLTKDVSSFCFSIAEDYYFNASDEFNLKITIDLLIKDKSTNKRISKKQKSVTLFKELTFSRDKLLPRACAIFFKDKFFSQIMKKLQLKQSLTLISDSKVFNKVNIDKNISKSVLKEIIIKEIKLNNVSLENKAYKFKDFTIENLIQFKGKNILDIFENNLFEYYCRTSNREVFFSIEVEYLNKKHKFVSNKITNNSGYETSIKKLNRLSKNNINIAKVKVNSFLNLNEKSIFDFRNISLTNLRSYNDLAYSLGYVLNNQGDIENFLANCIVKIENSTEITDIGMVTYNTNYFFFKELFNMQEFTSGTVSINESYIEDFVKTDEYFTIVNKKRNEINKNIIDFFLSSDDLTSFRKIAKEKSLNVENHINIKFLPIPEIISAYRGYDLDELGNPIDNLIYGDIENLSTIKSRIARELVVYLYTGNPNLNWSKFNKYKNILMDSTKSDSVNNYSEFFDDLVFLGMNENDYFKKSYRYDKNELLSLQNVDEVYLNSSLITSSIEEDFNKKYYNFSLSNKEVFIENSPFSILFQNNSYLSTENIYKPREIKIVKNESASDIKINITNLKNIYSIDQIKEARYYVRCSLHFLMKKEEDELNNSLTDNTDFMTTFFSGKNCMTYNSKYVNKNAASFSNLKNEIDISKIQCSIENDKLYLVINDDTNDLDICNLNYNFFASFFDFCNNNSINHLLKPILRFSVGFKVPQSDDFIFGVFNHNIPYINLNDKKLLLDDLSKIDTLIVT